MLKFTEKGHIYQDGEKIIPSVSVILNPSASKKWYTHGSDKRGTLAHERCAAYALNPVGFPYEPYVDAFALWCWKHNPKWLSVEEIIDGEVDGLRYAGRLDLFGDIDDGSTVVELKSGVKARWHKAQVGAYAIIKKPRRGLVLYLHDDMTYSEDWMSPSDLVSGIQEFRVKIKEYYESVASAKA